MAAGRWRVGKLEVVLLSIYAIANPNRAQQEELSDYLLSVLEWVEEHDMHACCRRKRHLPSLHG